MARAARPSTGRSRGIAVTRGRIRQWVEAWDASGGGLRRGMPVEVRGQCQSDCLRCATAKRYLGNGRKVRGCQAQSALNC
jgi:hypothetical protein